MELDPEIAESIVESLKDIINHEINLFNTSGTIIASTDTSRIGGGHDGARLAARRKETIIIDHADQFKGAKRGINVPVVFNNSVVAVIGITGSREEVEPFGNVIKKMTEILIRENWNYMTSFNQRVSTDSLVSTLISEHGDSSMASYLSSLVDIDLDEPRRAIVGIIRATSASSFNYNDLCTRLQARLAPYKSIFFSLNGQRLCMFASDRDLNLLGAGLHLVQDDISESAGCPIPLGIGCIEPNWRTYWRSYAEARRCASWLAFERSARIERYEHLDFGSIVSAIPTDDAERFVERVLGPLETDQIERYAQILDAYTRNNGSIMRCSEELFMHKNTFQNKLNRLKEKTGYNPRNLSDYAVLTVAFLLRAYLMSEARTTAERRALASPVTV
ncbi:transcriptional regulator, CdaR [Coriobacterium glomerans PW2]|uniref:Transcriptional regulator, CdaR n=1 Tax=Coriobacterium glomerans (strain ATCC 49209 / DSM 20642 / JCM 10262 / PW2) TaxID=700015 RepID=F2N8R8_CORGP|nr:sugar diacid recognition domain-containing protein [Coriobacterium glomerans]AEB07451.1 transcriptional regulator, CdaR [Coriobacterium glomerans PW2]